MSNKSTHRPVRPKAMEAKLWRSVEELALKAASKEEHPDASLFAAELATEALSADDPVAWAKVWATKRARSGAQRERRRREQELGATFGGPSEHTPDQLIEAKLELESRVGRPLRPEDVDSLEEEMSADDANERRRSAKWLKHVLAWSGVLEAFLPADARTGKDGPTQMAEFLQSRHQRVLNHPSIVIAPTGARVPADFIERVRDYARAALTTGPEGHWIESRDHQPPAMRGRPKRTSPKRARTTKVRGVHGECCPNSQPVTCSTLVKHWNSEMRRVLESIVRFSASLVAHAELKTLNSWSSGERVKAHRQTEAVIAAVGPDLFRAFFEEVAKRGCASRSARTATALQVRGLGRGAPTERCN